MGGGSRQRILKPFLVLSVRGLETRVLARQYCLSFTTPEMVRHEMGIITVGMDRPGNEASPVFSDIHHALEHY